MSRSGEFERSSIVTAHAALASTICAGRCPAAPRADVQWTPL